MDRNKIKIIALISMLLDHIGAFIIYPLYMDACIVDGVNIMGDLIPAKAKALYFVYLVLRIIGRLAFPIFAFMTVEGFRKTKNLKMYLKRLFIFAVISEIPYDLVRGAGIFDPSSQNVIWTFIIAVIMMWALEKISQKNENKTCRIVLTALTVSAAAAVSTFSDGGFGGILLIASMYLFGRNKTYYWLSSLISLCIMSIQFMPIQMFAAASLILLEKYNGEKGKGFKYLFYIFYPAHLFIIWLISPLAISLVG
ncbi:conjugal transfer protein TraX [Anaerotignum faecicola]|nr:conjugal transfer protein TraX [Anaerotignum faecicola]